MLFFGSSSYRDIIQVYKCVLQLLLFNQSIHHSLEHRNSIGDAKRYALELI